MPIVKFKPYDYKSNTESANYLSMGCKKLEKHGEMTNECTFNGVFNFNPIELYGFIAHHPFASRWCFVEKRTQYFKLFYDFDIDKYLPNLQSVDVNKFIKHLIMSVRKTLDQFIMMEKGLDDYIFSDRIDKFNFHLYFPNIIVNSQQAIALRKKLLDIVITNKEFNVSLSDYENIIDKAIYEKSGLKLLFQTKPHEKVGYKINMEKSTWKNIPENIIEQLILTSIRTDCDSANIEFVKDDVGFPLISNRIEKQLIEKEQTKQLDKMVDKILKPKKELVTDIVINFQELGIPENKFLDLFDNLNKKRFNVYGLWLKVMFLCKNYGQYDIAHEYSKLSKKYDKIVIDNLFNSKGNSDKQITIGSLFQWSKEDNPEKHNAIIVKYTKNKKVKYNHTDDILLKYIDNYKLIKYEETSPRISELDMEPKLLNIAGSNKVVIVLQQPTGHGKTTLANKLVQSALKEIEKHTFTPTILSIISRRSMAATHKTSFKDIYLESYLDGKSDQIRYITSLESLQYVKEIYDIVILDEFNSLITHFYSNTMAENRFKSLFRLIRIIKNASLVIVADAIMTDMSLSFITSLCDNIHYYRNRFQNKVGIHLDAYFINDKKSTEDDKIVKFCEKFKAEVELNKSLLIVCDSAKVAIKIRNYLSNWCTDSNYFKLYTATDYNAQEVTDCDKTWLKKCVISSPKIIYGLDCHIEYDNVYAIYKCKSMDGMCFLQQISRARECTKVNVLFIENNYKNKVNRFITFEENRILETDSFNDYMNNIKVIAHKQNNKIIETLCADNQDIGKIDEKSIFGKVHMFKSWYDRLFEVNKAQIFLSLCKEQGYTINYKELENVETGNSLKIAIQYHMEEQYKHGVIAFSKEMDLEISDAVLLNLYNDIGCPEKKFSDYCNHVGDMQEKITRKLNYIKVFKTELAIDDILRQIVFDDDVFAGCIRSLLLYYNEESIRLKQLTEFEDGLPFIEKDNRVFKRLELIRWIEKYFGINRFQVDFIFVNENARQLFVNELKKQEKLLSGMIDHNVHTLEQVKSRIKAKIDNLTSEDRVRKFVADIYNMFDNIILYDTISTRITIDNKKIRQTSYDNFRINNIVSEYHKKFKSKFHK